MDFKAKIEAAQEKEAQLKNDIAELMGLAEAENRDLTDDESIQLEAMGDDIALTVKRIENLQKAETALGMKTLQKQAPAMITRQGYGPERKKGEIIFRQATAALIAHKEGKGIEQVVSERYPHDAGLQDVVKTAVNPAMTGVTGWAEELVDDSLQGFQDLLRGDSIAAGLLAEAGTQLQFDGYGSIKIPSRAGGDTDMSSGWTGEGDAIAVKRGTLAPITIAPYKWAVISTFSKELAMRSTPSIEGLVRQFILQDTGTKLDNDFFGTAAAVAGVRPAGMFNGVAGSAGSADADLATRITEDLNALVSPILTAKMGRRLRILVHPTNAWLMSNILTATGVFLFREELNNGRLNMYEVRQSHNVPIDELLAIDMNEVAYAPGTPVFTASDTATIVEIDDDGVAPTMGADETPRTPSGTVGDSARDAVNVPPIRSLFQTESVALKHVQYMSWHKMRAGNVGRIHTIDYTS